MKKGLLILFLSLGKRSSCFGSAKDFFPQSYILKTFPSKFCSFPDVKKPGSLKLEKPLDHE